MAALAPGETGKHPHVWKTAALIGALGLGIVAGRQLGAKDETLKITDEAVHLLIGIEHDGKDGAWTFGGWRIVELSKLKVRLKAEFQASNADIYRKSALSHPAESP